MKTVKSDYWRGFLTGLWRRGHPPSILLIALLVSACSLTRSQPAPLPLPAASPAKTSGQEVKPFRAGFLGFTSPPPWEFRDKSYPMDFSELTPEWPSPFPSEFSTRPAGSDPAGWEPDLYLLNTYTLEAPFGVVDLGEYATNHCYDFSRLRDGLDFYTQLLIEDPVTAPERGYSKELPFELCHLYIVKTAEGNFTAFLNISNYIGGIDRVPLFWVYLPDGSRTFLPPAAPQE